MNIKNCLLIAIIFTLCSCTRDPFWDNYYRHVEIKPNTPEYNQELDKWKHPWRYKTYEPIQPKQAKFLKKKLSQEEKQELKRQAAEHVCQKKATKTIVIPHQPTEVDAYADAFSRQADRPAQGPAQRNSNALMAGLGAGLKGAANAKRQEPQVYTQFDQELFYLCMNEHGFYLEEQ